MCAQMMADESFNTTAVIIHKVQPLHDTLTIYEDATMRQRRDLWRRNNIIFVDTYVGAALQVFKLGLIHERGLHRVCTRAVEDFYNIFLSYVRPAGTHRARGRRGVSQRAWVDVGRV